MNWVILHFANILKGSSGSLNFLTGGSETTVINDKDKTGSLLFAPIKRIASTSTRREIFNQTTIQTNAKATIVPDKHLTSNLFPTKFKIKFDCSSYLYDKEKRIRPRQLNFNICRV